LWFECSNLKEFNIKAVNEIFSVILIVHRFIGFDNIVSIRHSGFIFNFGMAICAKFYVTYIDSKLNRTILKEALQKEATIVRIKSREQANQEMKHMFRSLEEAIIQVDKNRISFQNAQFETMMDHLK
jgi:hypothetical protein